MTTEDPKTQDITKKQWTEIHREGTWNTNFEQIMTLQYLGAKDFADVIFAKERVSFVDGLFVRYALDDFLKERGITIEKTVDFGHDGEYPPSYTNIEYEHGKYRKCLYSGCYLLKDSKGNKYIFDIDYEPQTTIFRLSANKEAVPNGQVVLQDLVDFAKQHNFLRGKKIDAKCSFIALDKKYDWNDLILDSKRMAEVRKNLYNLIAHIDIYRKNNIPLKRGLIFSGPPGTGKTLLGKVLCNVVDWTFIWVTPKHLNDSRDVSRIVGMARDLSPSILFLEDIDLYGGDRSSNGRTDILGELMNQLDGIQENRDIITIATTNNVEVLEKALLKRPGRFDRVIEFSEPSKESRLGMLQSFTKQLNLAEDVNLEDLVYLTDKMTGAQIRELVNFAVLQAIDDHDYDEKNVLTIKKAHFKKAIPTVKNKDHSVGFAAGGEGNDDDDDDIFPDSGSTASELRRIFGHD